MAKVVDVTDVPELPGAGLLHFDDGRPPLMALPEIADEHRERLGLNAMDNGVAGPGTGTPDPDAWKNKWGGTLGQVDPKPAAPAYAPPNQTPAAPAAAPPPSPQEAAGASPAPAAPPPDPKAQALAAQEKRDEDLLTNGKYVGPSAGRPGGYQPSAQKVVTEAGPAYDIQQAKDRMQAGADVLDATLAKADVDKQTAEEAVARATAKNLEAQRAAAEQSANIEHRKQAFQKQDQGLQKDLAAYTQSAAPDPNRFFKNRTVVANIFGAIGQGLGAFGASLNHTQNFAFDYVQNQIKEDIAAQEKEFAAGRADRTNALARLAEAYHGDMDMAKLALSQAMNKVGETETMKFAAQSQSKDITANAQIAAAQFKQQQLLDEQKRAELAAGKTTTTVEDKYQAPVAASGGHYVQPTEAEQGQAFKRLGGGAKTAKDQGALGLTAQAEARQKAAYGTKIEAQARFADAISHRATLMGIHFDPDTGELLNSNNKPAQESDLSVPTGAGVIGKHIAGDVLTPKAMELRRAEENSVRLHAAAVYNHSISAEEGATEVEKTVGSTDAAKLANMRYLAEEYRKNKTAIDTTAASIDPRLVNDRDAAGKAVNYSRATGKPLEGPTPRTGANGDSADEPENEPQ